MKLNKVFSEEEMQKLTLNTLIFIKKELKEYGVKLNDEDIDVIMKACNDTFQWYLDEIPF